MHNNNLINFLYGLATKYPTPSNLTYFWNFGVFSFFALIIQIVTGILLVMHYTPHVDLAFSSIEHIMRDLDWGWLLRYTHANGASLFFIVMYLHIARSLLYGSYVSRSLLWSSGVIIFLLTIITAFLGYILPWGQMSLWGATVITNLAPAIPVIGNTVVISLWGGFSVANPTLNRFFSLHYLLPFLILVLVLGHLFLLHISGSNNPLGTGYRIDGVQFGPYYIVKDIFSLSPLLIFFFWLILFIPNELGHPDNYILANSDITPAHIVPEWYFLIFYGILRSILSKSIGIILMLFSILLLFILVLKYQKVRTVLFQKIYHIITLLFIFIVVSLGYIGSKSIEAPYFSTGQKLTLGYFIVFLLYFFGDKFDSFFIKTALSTEPQRKNAMLSTVGRAGTRLASPFIRYDFSDLHAPLITTFWEHRHDIFPNNGSGPKPKPPLYPGVGGSSGGSGSSQGPFKSELLPSQDILDIMLSYLPANIDIIYFSDLLFKILSFFGY